MLTAVFLHGELGEKYGKELRLDVDSVAGVIALLKANFREFAKDVIGQGNAYTVWVGKSNLTEEELVNPSKGQDIHIVPHIEGSGGQGRNIFSIILGIVMVVVGVIFSEVGGGVLIEPGIGLIVGGVVGAIMTATQKKLTPNHTEGSNTRKPSYAFHGSVNTVGQGNPVPILYGRMVVGSQVVSGGISSQDSL